MAHLGSCWLWQGMLDKRGYGSMRFERKMQKAHRVAWRINRGPIPDGMCICHACDEPACVRVAHLFLGTHADNAADRDAKGRGNGGLREGNPRVKLTAAKAAEIRQAYLEGEKAAMLRQRFEISRTQLYRILRGESWILTKFSSIGRM
jgi:hypothetical protein